MKDRHPELDCRPHTCVSDAKSVRTSEELLRRLERLEVRSIARVYGNRFSTTNRPSSSHAPLSSVGLQTSPRQRSVAKVENEGMVPVPRDG